MSSGDRPVTFTFDTDGLELEGYHYLFLRVHLERYPDIFNDDVDFEVIFYHLATDLTINDQKYVLKNNALEISVPELVFSPELMDNPATFEDGT